MVPLSIERYIYMVTLANICYTAPSKCHTCYLNK